MSDENEVWVGLSNPTTDLCIDEACTMFEWEDGTDFVYEEEWMTALIQSNEGNPDCFVVLSYTVNDRVCSSSRKYLCQFTCDTGEQFSKKIK